MASDGLTIGKTAVEETVDLAVGSVLETMFFTNIDSANPGYWADWTAPMAVRLAFEGPLVGDFQIVVERETVRALACTLLCLDESELLDEHPAQVAGELTNMICGCLLSHLEPDANLTLGAPAARASVEPLEGSEARWFEIPEGRLGVELRVNSFE